MQPEQPTTPVSEPQAPVQPAPSMPVAPTAPVAAAPEVAPAQPPVVTEPAPVVQSIDEQPQMAITDTSDLPESEPIQWQAPEYVQEHRSPWWFIAFWIVVVVLMAIAAFVIRSWSFAVLVPAMAAALMIYSHRPPKIINYVLSDKGIYINEKLHPMSEFRSFGILREESIPGLMFIPIRRFRPGLTIHFPIEAGEAIVDLLGSRIPMQELRLDVFDRVIKTLHI